MKIKLIGVFIFFSAALLLAGCSGKHDQNYYNNHLDAAKEKYTECSNLKIAVRNKRPECGFAARAYGEFYMDSFSDYFENSSKK